MRAVRYAGAAGEPRIGRLEDDHVVDAGPAGAIGFDASPEAGQRSQTPRGRRSRSMRCACSTRSSRAS